MSLMNSGPIHLDMLIPAYTSTIPLRRYNRAFLFQPGRAYNPVSLPFSQSVNSACAGSIYEYCKSVEEAHGHRHGCLLIAQKDFSQHESEDKRLVFPHKTKGIVLRSTQEVRCILKGRFIAFSPPETNSLHMIMDGPINNSSTVQHTSFGTPI